MFIICFENNKKNDMQPFLQIFSKEFRRVNE